MSRENVVRPFLIGVAGGTCSGKTTVTERLVELVGSSHLALIKQDAYYIDRAHQPFDERTKANYDHPDAFDWNLTFDQLSTLLTGRGVDVPVYDYPNHTRASEVIRVEPTRIVVFEGILALYDERLRELFDLRIFVDTDADVRLIRRLERDVRDRGRTPESIMRQYMTTVRPSHLQFIEPTKRHADVIIPEGGHNDRALDVLVARVNSLVN
ncbi:MAG: uridine kinase [Actinomycetota bacterium]|nr:uridine kinase [Actinomycetota bacterium]MDA2972346.1 uridine kinase [Actinomycetota bacterium]MDA3000630.1 uridine kinase [Actinomycetota bacterium]